MAIEFGSGLSGLAASGLAAGAPSVRKTDRTPVGDQSTEKRLGFGQGTVSAVGVAAITVDRNLEAAREIVPTLDELSAEARARTDSVREQAANTEETESEHKSGESLRNESAARAQALGFEQRTTSAETPKAADIEQTNIQQSANPTSVRNVESIVSFVVPDPAASFDVFG
jgi:hypothetical protein